jgi:hypothetical protein
MNPHKPAKRPRADGNGGSRAPARIPLPVEDAPPQARVVILRGNLHVSFVVTEERLLDDEEALGIVAKDALALMLAEQTEQPGEATMPVEFGQDYRIVLTRRPELVSESGLIFRQRVYRLEDAPA